MYGEKAEEAEELKLDLLDVKAMYRSQVIILLYVMCGGECYLSVVLLLLLQIEELLNKQR